MPDIDAVCVFCGSSLGDRPAFAEAAAGLGRLLAEQGITLVYGGAHVGLMGVIADAALESGGEVHGVIPAGLVALEIAHQRLTELRVVETLAERKAVMAEWADAFVALPGGFGTLEELFEMVTATQVGFHTKPTGLLDIDGFFAPLLAFLDRTVEVGLMKADNRRIVLDDDDPRRLLERLREWRPAHQPKWIDPPVT